MSPGQSIITLINCLVLTSYDLRVFLDTAFKDCEVKTSAVQLAIPEILNSQMSYFRYIFKSLCFLVDLTPRRDCILGRSRI